MNYAPTYAARRFTPGVKSRPAPMTLATTPENRVVPFDQVVTFDLTGKSGNVLRQVFKISIEGYFVAVAMSYSLLPETPIEFGPVLPPEEESDELIRPRANVSLESLTLDDLFAGFQQELDKRREELNKRREELGEARFRELQLGLLRTERGFLKDGFRLNPALTDRVFSDVRQDGQIGDWRSFPVDSLGEDINRLFQAVVSLQAEVNFLYSILDNGTGRGFQSEPIHNLAGLGMADGDRPFRFFPEPIVFAPRSVILVQITEISGTGRFYFVLQGYKVLGT